MTALGGVTVRAEIDYRRSEAERIARKPGTVAGVVGRMVRTQAVTVQR